MALVGRLVLRSVKHCELGRCQGAAAAVRSQVIVILTPCGDGRARHGERFFTGLPALTASRRLNRRCDQADFSTFSVRSVAGPSPAPARSTRAALPGPTLGSVPL